jgi:ankyrin repeat protein
MSGRPNVVQALAGLGACVDSADRRGCSALQSAAARGHTSAVRVLLELGAKDGRRDVRRRNALDAAARAGRVEIVEMLVLHLADPAQIARTARIAYLRSAVNAARRHKRHDVVTVLELQETWSRVARSSVCSRFDDAFGDSPVKIVEDRDAFLSVEDGRASENAGSIGEHARGNYQDSVRHLTASRYSRRVRSRNHA